MIKLLLLFIFTFVHAQFEQEYKEAIEVEKSKDDAKALLLFGKILEKDSTQVLALVHSANLSSQLGVVSKSKKVKTKFFNQAMDFANKAIKYSPSYDEAYISLARAMGRLALISSTKKQLSLSKKIKKNVDKALKLNSENGIAWHILGKWYFKFAELSWFERTIAGLIYGNVPKATFKQAKNAFKKAMDLQSWVIAHKVEYAITCLELNQKKEAKLYLEKVVKTPIKLSTDEVYLSRAKKLLAKMD